MGEEELVSVFHVVQALWHKLLLALVQQAAEQDEKVSLKAGKSRELEAPDFLDGCVEH